MSKSPAASDNDHTAYVALLGSIDDEKAEQFLDIVANKLPKGTRTLHIFFSTGGGTVSSGFVIYNFLRALPYKVIMHNIGSVDSIGGVIFLAGEERYAVENGTFLIHRVSSELKENKSDESSIREKLSCICAEEEKIRQIFLERSKLSREEFEHLFEYGELKDASFALEKGIIHERRPIPLPPVGALLVVGQSS
jgi:ATP-dependent Clp protease protease subunit